MSSDTREIQVISGIIFHCPYLRGHYQLAEMPTGSHGCFNNSQMQGGPTDTNATSFPGHRGEPTCRPTQLMGVVQQAVIGAPDARDRALRKQYHFNEAAPWPYAWWPSLFPVRASERRAGRQTVNRCRRAILPLARDPRFAGTTTSRTYARPVPKVCSNAAADFTEHAARPATTALCARMQKKCGPGTRPGPHRANHKGMGYRSCMSVIRSCTPARF